ncbi:SLOG family protein [Streptomyces sp. H27-D2]|uniref:SLOG family protein n=1 Tax=Streptomyces sp. H27-D2 TaxID=3046304 RepID=UPI002DBF59BE|nr:SLOG family protein [Streptomyces sp. H27-D2]MEC4016024.1 SLOG family protein [Streptomyces sp. H27-D2]
MNTPYRILVTGSRAWTDALPIRQALAATAAAHTPAVVVHGACPSGADLIAAHWVEECGAHFGATAEPHPALWQINGKRAGLIRNQLMVNLGADLCLAFIRDGSRGASHTARLATAAGIPVRRWSI